MRVAVLGAGLQGASVALELAAHGISSDLYDRENACLRRASLHNEGKIHLGYVYANDPSLNSARMMAKGAAVFAPLLRRWLGETFDRLPLSKAFCYAVHTESLLTVEAVEAHLQSCRRIWIEQDAAADAYFGIDAATPIKRLTDEELSELYDPSRVQAVFRTPEISIDPAVLAAAIDDRVAGEPGICRNFGTEVKAVRLTGQEILVEYEADGAAHAQAYDHVINALWDGRLPIDRSAGLAVPAPWLFRLKYQMRITDDTMREGVASTTMVLGPFGDIVNFGGGELLLTWYPVSKRAATGAVAPPHWPAVPEAELCHELCREIHSGLAAAVPALRKLTPQALTAGRVGGGPIFTLGARDIDDPASRLHERYDIGLRSLGRYHSIDTGKLTTAPLFAQTVVERIRKG
jgi:glycine/D-amino acid oxidase-like deaminating enzyme